MGNRHKKDLQDIAIELKLTSRTMERQAVKLEAQEKNEKKRIRDVSKKETDLLCRHWTRVRWKTPKFTQKT